MTTARRIPLVIAIGCAVCLTAAGAAAETTGSKPAGATTNPLKGKALWQMVDALYGDFSKCFDVPRVASTRGKESPFLLPMPSTLRDAFDKDRSRVSELPKAQQGMVSSAFGIAYFLFALLISIALSSMFLWLGASIAGQRSDGKHSNFHRALICSSFDRVIIALLLVAITFGLGQGINAERLDGPAGRYVIPVMLLAIFFLISTYIVKVVFGVNWGRALLVQICTRVAVILIAVFILGFASALSLTAGA